MGTVVSWLVYEGCCTGTVVSWLVYHVMMPHAGPIHIDASNTQVQQRPPQGSPTSALVPASLMLISDGAEFSDANDAMLGAKHLVDESPTRLPQRMMLTEGPAVGWKGPSHDPWGGGTLAAAHYYNSYTAPAHVLPPPTAPAPPPPPMPPGPAALRRRAAGRKSTQVKREGHFRPHAAMRTASGALTLSTALLHSSSAPALGPGPGPRDPPPWEVALPDADRVGDEADELLQEEESESDVSGMAAGARSSSRARRTKQQWASGGRSSILKLEKELAELDTTVRTTLHQPVSEQLAGLANHSVANHVCGVDIVCW